MKPAAPTSLSSSFNATQKAQVHPGSRVEEEPPPASQRREAPRGGQQDEPGLALSPDGPGASPEPPSLTHTPDGNTAATDTLASDLLRKLAERQEVNCHGVRVKEEEEPMEIDTLAASDLIHDRPITKELTTSSPKMASHPHFTIKAEEDQGFSGSNATEQPHPRAKMAEQCLLGLKIEDAFFTGGCQSGSKTGDSVVSGANKFEFRFKMEDNGMSGTKMADQLLSGAKMDEPFLFKAKLAERPFSGAKISNRFLSGVKMEDQFPPGVKLENQLFSEARTADQLFSRAKTEEQLFFGANMEDQCLRAVLWQDMSVNLASTLLHQLSGTCTG
ncbi:hypothetical protein INR49_007091 [Caranx melampygus]|nr:hypothetical protein INR49_007091 [Caranx melampygus]